MGSSLKRSVRSYLARLHGVMPVARSHGVMPGEVTRVMTGEVTAVILSEYGRSRHAKFSLVEFIHAVAHDLPNLPRDVCHDLWHNVIRDSAKKKKRKYQKGIKAWTLKESLKTVGLNFTTDGPPFLLALSIDFQFSIFHLSFFDLKPQIVLSGLSRRGASAGWIRPIGNLNIGNFKTCDCAANCLPIRWACNKIIIVINGLTFQS